MCSLRQQRILSDAIDALREQGYLIYSTCSYSREEDEANLRLDNRYFHLTPVMITNDSSWGIVETSSEKHAVPGYRFYPDKIKGEGFFIACFQQGNPVNEYYGYQKPAVAASKNILSIAEPFLENSQDYVLRDHKEIVIASLKKWEDEIATVSRSLYVRKSGVAIGTVKGKDLIPHHELALSNLLSLIFLKLR
jgi:hypothetical protein